MADFNWYINRQGIRGAKGEKGEDGFTPSIEVATDELNEYTLTINNEFNSFTTPNLRSSRTIVDGGGTYLRFNSETQEITASGADSATSQTEGVMRIASDDDITNFIGNAAITPSSLADTLPIYLTSPDNSIAITQNEDTSYTELKFNDVAGFGSSISTLQSDVTNLTSTTSTQETEITNLQSSKQNKLVQGKNITLTDNTDGTTTISSTGGVTEINVTTPITSDPDTGVIGLAYDNQTIQVNTSGQLCANFDEIGNELNAVSARVTATEASISTLESEMTEVTGILDIHQASITALEYSQDSQDVAINRLSSTQTTQATQITSLKSSKQDKLTAGDNITITYDESTSTTTISATGSGEVTAIDGGDSASSYGGRGSSS